MLTYDIAVHPSDSAAVALPGGINNWTVVHERNGISVSSCSFDSSSMHVTDGDELLLWIPWTNSCLVYVFDQT